MQHLYSLRGTRAPTAASEENPLPIPSIAKSRKFISDNIGHAIRRTAGGTLAPEMAKKSARLVAMEKNILRSMENVSKERVDNAQHLSLWGAEQEDDVSDVSDKLSVLLSQLGDLEDQYVDRYDYYRNALKDIRDIEKVVQPLRNEKQSLIERIGKLQTQPEKAEEIPPLEQELERVDAKLIAAEVQLVTITRQKFKAGFNYQLDAMRELGEKMSIISGYGKHLLELVHEEDVVAGEERIKYNSYEASEAIVKECDRALTAWVGSNAEVSTKLSGRVQSMILEKKSEDAAASGTRSGRRWSSDSEGEDRAGSSSGKTSAPVPA